MGIHAVDKEMPAIFRFLQDFCVGVQAESSH